MVLIVVTIYADSWMSDNMLREVSRRLATGRYVGGGVRIMPERMSLGIFFSTMTHFQIEQPVEILFPLFSAEEERGWVPALNPCAGASY